MSQKEYNGIFQRIETKYMLSPEKFNTLADMLTNYTRPDEYGKYTICNLYLDTPDYRLIRASIEKPLYKEKIRLRSYGVASGEDKVFLELKKKFKGTVYKRRISLTCSEAESYFAGGEIQADNPQIFNEIDWIMKRHNPKPSVFLAYDRTALYGVEDRGLRITFDTDMRWRTDDLTLREDPWGAPIIDGDDILMEIKALGAMPLWLAKTLSELEIFPASFSKYGTCYRSLFSVPKLERRYTCA